VSDLFAPGCADCTPDWDDLPLDDLPYLPADLWGQGTPAHQIAAMTDVTLTEDYL
jgi:hypothetical protein